MKHKKQANNNSRNDHKAIRKSRRAQDHLFAGQYQTHSFDEPNTVEYLRELSARELFSNRAQSTEYSHKQIAIAYCVMGITITKVNAESILQKHSSLTSSAKLIQNRVSKVKDLTLLSHNKSADTKHLQNLNAAKQLISGTRNKDAKTEIIRIITAFQTAYNDKY